MAAFSTRNILHKLLTVIVFVALFTTVSVSCDDELTSHETDHRNKRKVPEESHDVKPPGDSGTANPADLLDSDPIGANSTQYNSTLYDENQNLTDSDKSKHLSYFNSTVISDPKLAMAYWIDLNQFKNHETHKVLSDSHRRAASITMPFAMPFYGNLIEKVTIATGGFLYMGDYIHAWLAATQYVAPLMANFDTRNSSESHISYGSNSTLFVVQWEQVRLQEKPEYSFSFQCLLYNNGDIVFVYKNIPISISDIGDSNHPVKIGVSDAYFINRHQLFIRRKTIYEYHKIDILSLYGNQTISNNTAIYFKALKTCNSLKNCDDCLNANINFKCVWCEEVQRCSDGYDRQRQEWINKRCDTHSINEVNQCSAINTTLATNSIATRNGTTTGSNTFPPFNNNNHDKGYDVHEGKNQSDYEFNNIRESNKQRVIQNGSSFPHKASGFLITFTLLFSLISGFGLWILYAYRNPTTPSGQLLIQWRPSVWRRTMAETRYTAASIHM